jgi:hypothetical protein
MVLAAAPAKQAGTVIANQNGTLTVKTKTQPHVDILESQVPGSKQLMKIKTGRHVMLTVNPATQVPLSVVPRPGPAVNGRWTVGTLVSGTAQSLSMHNQLGTESVLLAGRTVKVMWPHHPGASLSQVPKGSSLMVHLAAKNTLIIHVR